MPPIVTPYVPQNITVHLGAPGESAPNVTVSFIDYVKNVASSEIYPTWDESALRANILAIVSFALNRVYTEFYRSRGYDFDITNSTAIDQSYVPDRSYFENISQIEDAKHVTVKEAFSYSFDNKSFIYWMVTCFIMTIGLQLFLGGINEVFSSTGLNMTIVMASSFAPVPLTIMAYNKLSITECQKGGFLNVYK